MPNTRIRDQWEPDIKGIVADHPKWGPHRICEELLSRARDAGEENPDLPSERTIGRIKKKLTPTELMEYKTFHWPQSMESGSLPWEASAAAFELLRAKKPSKAAPFLDDGLFHTTYFTRRLLGRPTVRQVRWFWRVTQAMPRPRGAKPEAYLYSRRAIVQLLLIWEDYRGQTEDMALVPDRVAAEEAVYAAEEAITWESTKFSELSRLLGIAERAVGLGREKEAPNE